MSYVIFNGRRINVTNNNCLYLQSLGIEDLEDVIGLEKLTHLRTLSLWENNLKEIKKLEKMTKLEHLILSYNNLWNFSKIITT